MQFFVVHTHSEITQFVLFIFALDIFAISGAVKNVHTLPEKYVVQAEKLAEILAARYDIVTPCYTSKEFRDTSKGIRRDDLEISY